jgi:hypothetical protein
MNDFKNPWEITDEMLANPWEVGGGRSVLDREQPPKCDYRLVIKLVLLSNCGVKGIIPQAIQKYAQKYLDILYANYSPYVVEVTTTKIVNKPYPAHIAVAGDAERVLTYFKENAKRLDVSESYVNVLTSDGVFRSNGNPDLSDVGQNGIAMSVTSTELLFKGIPNININQKLAYVLIHGWGHNISNTQELASNPTQWYLAHISKDSKSFMMSRTDQEGWLFTGALNLKNTAYGNDIKILNDFFKPSNNSAILEFTRNEAWLALLRGKR